LPFRNKLSPLSVIPAQAGIHSGGRNWRLWTYLGPRKGGDPGAGKKDDVWIGFAWILTR